MKRRFVFCLGAMLFAGTLAAQTPVPEWQAGVDKVKSLIKANPEQASDAAGELLKGKNKKNVGKSSVSCPLKPSDSAPLKHSTMPP